MVLAHLSKERTVPSVSLEVQPPSPWTQRHWPFDAAEEGAFVAELKGLAAAARRRRVRRWGRSDVTVVVTALRCGTSASEVCGMLTGVNPWRLVAAYNELEKRRSAAAAAWMSIVANPTFASLERYGDRAGELVPVPVGRLEAAAEDSDATLATAVAVEHRRIEGAWRLLDDALAHLCGGTVDVAERVIAARMVFHPDGTGLIGSPTLLARRVGELSPLRVAELIGDDGDEDE
jgi:hypothetical protein